MMESFEPYQIWLLVAAVGYAGFVLGRASAGAGGADGAEREMLARQEAERLFSSLSPSVQQEVDARLQAGKVIEAIKIIRENSGVSLKDAKLVADMRRASMGLA